MDELMKILMYNTETERQDYLPSGHVPSAPHPPAWPWHRRTIISGEGRGRHEDQI